MKWYGPKDFTTPSCEIDLKVGGRHLWSMKAPDGMLMYFTGIYKEIVPMERIVYTDSMSDAEGNLMYPSVMGMPEGSPASMAVTVTFAHERWQDHGNREPRGQGSCWRGLGASVGQADRSIGRGVTS